MDDDPSNGTALPRDRLPPPHEPSYRANGSVRDEALRMRPQPDLARHYSRSDLEPPPLHNRPPIGWSEHESSHASLGMRDAPSSRAGYTYPRPVESIGARHGPYPPSDPPRPSRSMRPDEYYAGQPPGMSSLQDSGVRTSHLPPHRLARFEEEAPSAMDGRSYHSSDAYDPYGPPGPARRLSGDPKVRTDAYAGPSLHASRPVNGHTADSRTEPPHARVHSPGHLQPTYPTAIPPRRVSNTSPPYPGEAMDGSLHRDKRARLDLYPERSLPGSDPMLRPPPLPTSSSYRSVASSAVDWPEQVNSRDRRPREYMDAAFHGESGSKHARTVDWADSERGLLSRRTSAVSHHTSSEALSTNSQSSKVKRRKRAVLSCTECKQRKIKCDRNVPNCGSCVRRGVAHLCRWGDERDFLPAAPASNITPSNAALMARIAQLEAQVRVMHSSSSSSSAVHDAGASDTILGQGAVTKHGASQGSSDRSSRFSGRSSIQNPPDFTSRERKATSSKTRDGYARGRDAHNQLDVEGEEAETDNEDDEESEQSDESAESGAENAGDLLRALAKGTSLKTNRAAGLPRKKSASDTPQALSAQPVGGRARGTDSGAVHGETLDKNVRTMTSSSGNNRRSSLADEELTSAAMLNIFTANTTGKTLEALRAAFLEALGLLPTRHKVEALIDHYLREAEPIVQSIHKPSFFHELNRFWAALDQIRAATNSAPLPPLPDLQFGAFLLAVCEGACEFMTPAEVLESGISKSRTSINDQLALLARSCLNLLGMGQFVRRPNIWGMQTVIALRHYCYNRDHREEYTILCSMTIKAAEFMGLHRLGSALKDEERWLDDRRARALADDDDNAAAPASTHRWKMLTATQARDGFETDSEGEDLDPDRSERRDMNAMWLPRGARRKWELAASKRYKDGSHVSREHGRKVWFALATMDWLSAAYFDRCYCCKDEMFTTQSPQNIDDSDLTDSESIQDEVVANPHRPDRTPSRFLGKIRVTSIPTTNSFIPIHIEICHTVRSIADAMNAGDESFETVLAIEARFREILRSLPRFFKLDGESEYDPEIHRFHRERPYLSMQRAVIHEYVHHRLLKLHRLYMSRGYWNAKYIHSTRTCLESARVVIGILRALDHVGSRGQRYLIFKFHIFHAVLALQVDLLYLARQPINSEILAKRADVVAGLKMLHARTDVEGRNPVLASSLKVIKVLREEEQARRSKITAGSESHRGSDSVSASSPTGSTGSHKKSKAREWTGASESTGELAEHLERRIKETWHFVEVDDLRTRAEAVRSILADARSPDLAGPAAIPQTPSTEDGSSLHTADLDLKMREPGGGSAVNDNLSGHKTRAPLDQDRPDTELDDYLKLLSSYQNPDDAPDGAHFFDVLDDLVFENGSANKLDFGQAASLPLTSELPPALPLLRGADDLAAAGAGFDAFTSA